MTIWNIPINTYLSIVSNSKINSAKLCVSYKHHKFCMHEKECYLSRSPKELSDIEYTTNQKMTA